LAPKDLGTPREQSRAFCEIAKTRVWRASLFAATAKEVKNAQSSFKLGSFGLSIVLLGRSSTGSSISAPVSHEPYCRHHNLPLSPTS